MTSASEAPAAGSESRDSAGAPPARWAVVLSHAPLPLLHLLARCAALLALLLMRSPLRIVHENLAAAFPATSPQDRRRLARTFVRNLADVVVETIKAHSIDKAALSERVRITNLEVLERFARDQQSIVLLGSHEANWEWILLSCSSRVPFAVDVVYAPLRGASIDAFLYATRSRFGAALWTRQEASRRLIDGHHRLRAIVLTVDERPKADDEQHWVRFLDQDTAFRSSFETLARLWRYPVLFASRRRTARGHYEVTFVTLGEPPYDGPPGQLVERYARCLERSIREHPADWLWTQRRWEAKRPFYD